jgi:hypothetical protein
MVRVGVLSIALAAAVAMTAGIDPGAAQSLPKCDEIGDADWRIVPALETVGQADSKPYQNGTPGNWFVDRTTTVLPFCHYYNSVGNYSLRSYSLSPEDKKERIGICKGTTDSIQGGGSVAIAPYAGPCPPM